MYWVEIRPTVRRVGRPRLVSLHDVGQYRGFRSVFAFDDDTKALIEEAGTTANLRGTAVYADTLFFDFDGHDPTDFRRYLHGSGLAFSEWASGGRSVHFHVRLEPVFGSWVPLACKLWTREHAPTADTSFLHPTGMYRLPHTFHAKYAGRRKELVHAQEGVALVLREPAARPVPAVVPESSLDQLYFLLTASKGPGHRSGHIWLLATTAAECGLPVDDALDKIRDWNARQTAPQTERVILQQIDSAYRRAQRTAL